MTNYELGASGRRRKPQKSPPFAKGGLGGFYTYTYTYTCTPALRNRGFDAETQRNAEFSFDGRPGLKPGGNWCIFSTAIPLMG